MSNPPRGRVLWTAPPDTLPVTWQELAEALGITPGEDEDENPRLEGFAAAARDYCEAYTGVTCITSSAVVYYDGAAGRLDEWWDGVRQGPVPPTVVLPPILELPVWPLQDIGDVLFFPEDGGASVVMDETYLQKDFDSRPPRIALLPGATWPTITLRPLNSVGVEIVAGFGDDGTAVPAALKEGIKAVAMYLHDHAGACDAAEAVNKSGALMLWSPWRRKWL